MAQYKQYDRWLPWVWCLWAFTVLTCTIFAILCCYTYSEFHRIAGDPVVALPDSISKPDWVHLFNGAAGSAFFAVLIVILFLALSVYYMICSTRRLSHPQNRYGRGVLVTAAFYSALQVCNVSVHFTSFGTAINSWVSDYHANFNRSVLIATYVLGYFSTAFFLIFSFVVVVWRDKGAESLENQVLSVGANSELSHF